jgi:eukaryotic-like serine/threonine-protein kinase
MTLAPGTKLGPYEILALIGAGGMGEVYRAHDPRVGRDVAIKVSSEQFTSRFTREIHAVAALNHPNIAALYDVGPNYLVMELVEGPTLADRIKQGPIPLEESLEIAKQIADALEAAHEKGIVHRDLKPANIKLRPDGMAKVLDFGLAKVEETAAVSLETSPTLSVAQTAAGVLLGTAAYMSPEQARGKPVDKRADIWAFGVVLYEMLTGRQLFSGETVSDTLAATLKEEPGLEKIPAKVRPLLRSCLEKNPSRRLRDIGDAWRLLETLPGSTPARTVSSWIVWFVAAVFVVAFTALFMIHFRDKPPVPSNAMRFQIPFPDNVAPGFYRDFALSPDGRFLVFSASGPDGVPRLWLRRLDSSESRPLDGTESSGWAIRMFWSPDSRFIAFVVDGKLKKIDVDGGPPQTMCDLAAVGGLASSLFALRPLGGSWSRNGLILLGTQGGVVRVSVADGSVSPVTKPDPARGEGMHGFPTFFPDGDHFLYLSLSNTLEKSGIYIGSLNTGPDEQQIKRIATTEHGFVYVPSQGSDPGWLLFLRDQTLLAQPLDEKRLEAIGEPLPIADPVGSLAFFGFFSASTNGVLIFRSNDSNQMIWVDRTGRELNRIGEPGQIQTFDLSRDGRQLVVSKSVAMGQQNLWIFDLLRGSQDRLTLKSERHTDPRWSPDGRQVMFTSSRDPSRGLYQISLPASDPVQVFQFSGAQFGLDDWSPDGRYVLYHDGGRPELWALPLSGDRKPMVVTRSLSGTPDQARFSPDGRWIAYNTNESGRYEVKVVPFPSTDQKWQISIEGGLQPAWSGNGRELYFLARDAVLMAVDIHADAKFEWGEPHRLFKTSLSTLSVGMEQYAPSPDGQRFLLVAPSSEISSTQFNVILNWTALLKR